MEYEEQNEEEGSVGFIDDEGDDDDDASYSTPPQRSTKKPKAKKTFSRPRLYAIACRRGGFARGGSLSRGVGEAGIHGDRVFEGEISPSKE